MTAGPGAGEGVGGGRSKPESEAALPTPLFLGKPRGILANAGFYLNFSILIPRFKGPAVIVLE